MEVSPEVIKELKDEGYSEEEINQAVNRVKSGASTSTPSRATPTPSQFQFQNQDNLIKFQLDLSDILERAEHILRQDVVEIQDGNVVWSRNQDETQIIFNEYAVQEIMRVLSMYINRNTILSDFEPEEIEYKVYDFGKELNDLIFMKYEDFFVMENPYNYFENIFEISFEEYIKEYVSLNFSKYFNDFFGGETKFKEGNWFKILDNGTLQQISPTIVKMIASRVKKDFIISSQKTAQILRNELRKKNLERRKNYPMLVRQLIDLVHSAYKRAQYGGERSSLRTARSMVQQETIAPAGINISTGMPMKERGILNPARYLGGKYK